MKNCAKINNSKKENKSRKRNQMEMEMDIKANDSSGFLFL